MVLAGVFVQTQLALTSLSKGEDALLLLVQGGRLSAPSTTQHQHSTSVSSHVPSFLRETAEPSRAADTVQRAVSTGWQDV